MEDMYSLGVGWGSIKRTFENLKSRRKIIKKNFRKEAMKILLEIKQIRDEEISNPVVSRKIYSLLGRAMLIGLINKSFHDKVMGNGFH